MRDETSTSSFGRRTWPISAFLLIGTGVAIAQPAATRKSAPPAQPGMVSPTVNAATIRIVLPPPADLAPPTKRAPTGTIRISLVSPSPEPSALVASGSSMAPALVAPIPSNNDTMDVEQAEFAKPKNGETKGFSAKLREITASLGSAPIPQDAAALANERAGAETEIAGEAYRATKNPASANRALVGGIPDGDSPLGPSDRAQAILTEVMKPKRRSVPSVSLQVSTTVDGTAAGRVSLFINDPENISVRLSELLAILEPAIEPALYERLSGSQAAQTYMTLNELRVAGIGARFDDDDRLILDTPRQSSPRAE